jgi:hypothetical protein
VHGLVHVCEALLVRGLEPLLTAANYTAVVQLAVDHIVMRLEALVLQKRFNQVSVPIK